MNIVTNKRLLVILLISSIIAIINFPPNSGSEIKKDDKIQKNSTIPHLFLQFTVLMFSISVLSYQHLMKYQTLPLSNLEYCTIALIFIGFILRMSCYYELGSLFTFTIKTERNHKLIKTGPYKYLAHPSYIAQVLVIVGSVFLLTKSWIATLGLLVISYVMISKRIKIEEKLMRKKFGNKYNKYMKNRYKLIPFIY